MANNPEYRFIGIFSRCVTIERCNSECFRTEGSVRVELDGQALFSTRQNVISVHGLEPKTKYVLRLIDEESGDAFGVEFSTKKETILLDVRKFGALGDGIHDDTAAIQAAISSCPKNGTVRVPRGTFLTAPLFMKSYMTFWLDKGAVLLGHADRSRYPVLPGIIRHEQDNKKEYNLGSWEGNPLDSFASLITGIHVKELSIIGEGRIDGNADKGDWWEDVRVKRTAWRPKLMFFNDCKDVQVQGITVGNSPCWAIHPYYSKRLSFMDLTIQNPPDSPNTDGFDPESCKDVLLIGTRISVGDDCIAIKSGKLYMATAHPMETKKIEIRNCLLERGHGSVTVGSEISAGVKKVRVSQCVFSRTDRGVRIKTRRGRGEKSVLDEILIENVEMDGVHMPLTVNMFYFCDPDGHTPYVQSQESLPVDYRTPHIGTLRMRDVRMKGVDASVVCAYGLPESPIGCIALENVWAEFLPEKEREPQRPIMMDDFAPMSGRSLYLKNVREVSVKDVKIIGSADKEPELINVENKNIHGLIME